VSLTASDIAEIARLLDESRFSSLDLQMGEFRLRIRRDGGGWIPQRDEPAEPEAPTTAPEQQQPSQEAGAARAGEVDVPAPLLGNFYSAPRPGDPPFVQVGDTVNEDTTIGIIEVMKLMNPIRAGVAGTVAAVLIENGKAVEEGQPLVRVRVG
jgi:acetyl-CoA carboxylase biotin carboxyl carrier protein